MKRKILFIYLSPTSFVRDDLELFSEEFTLVPFHFDIRKARSVMGLLGLLVRQLGWLIRNLKSCDAVFGWFADYHMVLPAVLSKWYRKPLVLSLGGYECIHLPQIGYGVYDSRWRAPLARRVLKRASLLLPVAKALICSKNRFSEWPEERQYGLCAYLPGYAFPYQVLPTGYVPERWRNLGLERSAIVSTVALVGSERTLLRKGIDLLIEAARLLPDVEFRIIGVEPDYEPALIATYHPPPNVQILHRMPREALEAEYNASAVYAQLSRAEGMPNVLCEAMLCGCLPVASNVFGNGAAVGDIGFLVDEPDPQQIADALRKALEAPEEQRQEARAHIMKHFLRSHRKERFENALNKLLSEI